MLTAFRVISKDVFELEFVSPYDDVRAIRRYSTSELIDQGLYDDRIDVYVRYTLTASGDTIEMSSIVPTSAWVRL